MKKLKKDVIGVTKIGVVSGIGATGITAVGGSAAGLTTLSGMMPTVTTVMGSGAVMRQVRKLPKPKKKKRRRK